MPSDIGMGAEGLGSPSSDGYKSFLGDSEKECEEDGLLQGEKDKEEDGFSLAIPPWSKVLNIGVDKEIQTEVATHDEGKGDIELSRGEESYHYTEKEKKRISECSRFRAANCILILNEAELEASTSITRRGLPVVCRYWKNRVSSCRYGENCRYAHSFRGL